MPGALALPDGPGPSPAVVVIHEALGLNDDIRRIAGRFAANGYVALAPDLLDGLGPQPFCLVRFARGIGRRGTGRPYRQLEAARSWLAQRLSEQGLTAAQTRSQLKATAVSGLSTGGRRECASYPALNLRAALGG